MSYLSDKLKEALGGEKVLGNRNSVIRDWTPNNIKALIIARSYILVLRHVGGFEGFKVVQLETNLVAEDLNHIQQVSYKPKLNSILQKRSLSCLEEIYIDTVFMKDSIIDIIGYVDNLRSSCSRLRYFGYGDFPSNSENIIKTLYKQNKKSLDYCLAKDNNSPIKIEYRYVADESWYKHYFLRPQYYKLDEDRGKLALHFKKFEEDYEKYLLSKKEVQLNTSIDKTLSRIIGIDIANIPYLKKFDMLLKYLAKNSEDTVSNLALGVVKKNILNSSVVIKGLKKQRVIPILGDFEEKEYLLKSYERYSVLDKNNDTLDISKIKEYTNQSKGLIDISDILDNICLEITGILLKRGYKDMVSLALVLTEQELPNGKTRDLYMKKKASSNNIDGYFKYLGEMIGIVL